MHISKIELENIKSHVNSTFEFTRGTTAITGENGAGKTSIIEAIAWVLFDLLEYKKEEFVRRGAKKGAARITIESDLDEREYIVYRDSASGYYVEDPRLRTRIANKKEEVFRFLWQHLGLEPGTDLRSLFRQAIGVPQGTFTAIFLEGSAERKIAFDRLLKVEEYRQAAEKLRETVRFLDNSITSTREKIARAEGVLIRADVVEEEYRSNTVRIAALSEENEMLSSDAEKRRQIVASLDEIEVIENGLAAACSDQKRVSESLENAAKARAEVVRLTPAAEEQAQIEREVSETREKLAVNKAAEKQKDKLEAQLERLRANYKANLDQIKDAEARSVEVGILERLERQDADLITRIASMKATLERDQRFQDEIKNGLCPVLSQACLNLKPGETLAAFISSQFSELRLEISAGESARRKLADEIKSAREAEKQGSLIPEFRKRQEDLKAEGQRLAAEKENLDSQMADISVFESRLAELDSRLRGLDDPKGRIRFLEREAARENEWRSKAEEIDARLGQLSEKRLALLRELQFDEDFIYDKNHHRVEKSALLEAEKRLAENRATLAAHQRRTEQLEAEIEKFGETRKSLANEQREKERLESVAETTSFIRDTLKEAAPRVARNYVYHVSLEANQLFREITGSAERSLVWCEDYSITVEEDGFDRPFVSLSGGEQMAAALSVRLALLKQLTDIRIAFFDEPTTNMDAERRENLAQQISRITHFDQLFVISHDETFDNYVDNVVAIG